MLDFVRISYINPDYQLTSVNEILSYLLTAVSVWGEYGGLGSRITLLVFSRQHCRYNFFHVIKAVIIQNPHFESLINNLHDSFHIYLCLLYTSDAADE